MCRRFGKRVDQRGKRRRARLGVIAFQDHEPTPVPQHWPDFQRLADRLHITLVELVGMQRYQALELRLSALWHPIKEEGVRNYSGVGPEETACRRWPRRCRKWDRQHR